MSQETKAAGEGEGDEPAPTGPPANPVGEAVGRNRTTAKWLIGIAGTVAGALIASLKLSNVGDLTGADLLWASVGFALGILGATVAVISMTQVLSNVSVSLKQVEDDTELRKAIAEDPDLWLGGFTDFETLRTTFSQAARDRITIERERPSVPATGTARKAFDKKVATVATDLAVAEPAIANLLDQAAFRKAEKVWKRAVIGFSIGVVIAAAGTFIYAIQSPQDDPSEPSVVQDPTPVVVNLNDAGDKLYRERLGAATCDTDAMHAVATSSADGATTVITDDVGCKTIQLTLKDTQADIAPICNLDVASAPKNIVATTSTIPTTSTPFRVC